MNKFIDHLKIIVIQQIKEEFISERLKTSITTGLLSLNDYLFAVAAHLPVIKYFPEWLAVDEDDLECLNNALLDVSLDSIEETGDLSEEGRAFVLAQELENELTNWENS